MNYCLDKRLEVSKDQEILATAYSNSIVCGSAGEAEGTAFDVRVSTKFTTADAGTLTVAIQDSPDGDTFTTRVSAPALAATALTASKGGAILLSLGVPKNHAKHIRLAYTVANNFTAGKVTAGLNTVR